MCVGTERRTISNCYLNLNFEDEKWKSILLIWLTPTIVSLKTYKSNVALSNPKQISGLIYEKNNEKMLQNLL